MNGEKHALGEALIKPESMEMTHGALEHAGSVCGYKMMVDMRRRKRMGINRRRCP